MTLRLLALTAVTSALAIGGVLNPAGWALLLAGAGLTESAVQARRRRRPVPVRT